MKSSNMERARLLTDRRKIYAKMQMDLAGYPGYDATLTVNGKVLAITRTQANTILDEYLQLNERDMDSIGLEFDE